MTLIVMHIFEHIKAVFNIHFLFHQEIKELFKFFDKDGSGTIDFEEFLKEVRVSYVYHWFASEMWYPHSSMGSSRNDTRQQTFLYQVPKKKQK